MPRTAGTSMPTQPVLVRVPTEHVEVIDETATASYSNRATVVRQIIAEWAERKRQQTTDGEVS